ncbi:hypothetical protein JOD57_000877 [Geodermatophilus bullaregiensis]|nr:hypothetical protein [Geodermatophilus bullaregiensis]
MVAADGTPLLWSESGFASPEVAGGLPGPIADLLARAPELAERVRQLKERPPAVSPAALIPAGIEAFAANSRLAGLHTCLSLLTLIPSASTVK